MSSAGAQLRGGNPKLRRLLLGDWGPLVRDPIDLLRIPFLIGAVVALAGGHLGGAVRLALTFGIVLVPRLISVPRPFDLAFVLGMAFQGFGNTLNLFEDFGWYDKVVHFVLPLSVAPLLYLVLIRLDAVPDLSESRHHHRRLGIFIITLGLGISIGTIYEIYEYFAVHQLGATLAIGYADTIGDLVDDSIASAAGAALLIVWGRIGWGTTRQPGLTAGDR